jgi:NADH-quinone oxidoreductase subunit M
VVALAGGARRGPGAALGPAAAVFADGFRLDAVQDRWWSAGTRARRPGRPATSGWSTAPVEGTGASTTRLGACWPPPPAAAARARAAVFAGALLLGVAPRSTEPRHDRTCCSSPCWRAGARRAWSRCCRPARPAAPVVATAFAAVTFVLTVAARLGRIGWFAYGRAPRSAVGRARRRLGARADIDFHLGVDGVSYPLIVLTGLLTLLCCAYTVGRSRTAAGPYAGRAAAGPRGRHPRHLPRPRPGVVLRLLRGRAAADVRGDRRLGRRGRRAAARKFVLYTLFGSVLLLLGVFTVVVAAGTGDLVALTGGNGLSTTTQYAAFALFAIAFAVKAPLWPLHTWLPDAHTQAPTVGSVILAGVLLKMGTYGLIRVGVGVAPAGRRVGRAGARHPGRRRDPGRRADLPAADRAETPDRLLQRRPHGLRAARHRDAHRHRHPGGADRQRGARPDHRPAVLPRRGDQGPLAHRPAHRPRRPAGDRARLAGVLGLRGDRSLGLPGLAGFWGEAFAWSRRQRGWRPVG